MFIYVFGRSEYIYNKYKLPVPDWSSAACFVRTPRFMVYKYELHKSAFSTNVIFHTRVSA